MEAIRLIFYCFIAGCCLSAIALPMVITFWGLSHLLGIN